MNPSFPTLPAFLCWYIWNETNITIFEAGSPSFQKVVYKAIGAVSIHGIKAKDTLPCIVRVNLLVDRAIAWFDGETQQWGEKSGAGGKIMTNSNTSVLWTFNYGQGTNTRDELLGAWASLTLAIRLSISDLLLLGDSKIVIEWLNKRGVLQEISLES